MALLIRGAVLVAAYWAVWVAIGRALPYWLTIVAAAAIWPLALRYHAITTSPKSMIVVPMTVGVLGAAYGRTLHRRSARLLRVVA